METVDHSIDLTGVSKTLPDERQEDDINIDVNKIKGIEISDNDNTQLKGVSMVVVEKSSRKSTASKTLPDKRKEGEIIVDVDEIKEIEISDVEILSRKSSRHQNRLLSHNDILKKILHEDREYPGVTGHQSSDDCKKIEQCIAIQSSKLKQSKKSYTA